MLVVVFVNCNRRYFASEISVLSCMEISFLPLVSVITRHVSTALRSGTIRVLVTFGVGIVKKISAGVVEVFGQP